MIKPMLVSFANPEHHCRFGPHSDLVGGAMHFEPIVGEALQTGDLVPDLVIQNLGTATWNRIEPRIA